MDKRLIEHYLPMEPPSEEERELFDSLSLMPAVLSEHLSRSRHFTSAHALAEAAALVFSEDLRAVAGRSLGYMHAWLETKTKHVIDLMPISIMSGPIFVHKDHLGLRRFYVQMPVRDVAAAVDNVFDTSEYRTLVESLLDPLRELKRTRS
ncbi:MAG: hypothetical protein JWN89_696 [Parcubacteria group bacterium]|nr:hypothetical protein [Parcubacteria group bacterium]